MNSVKLQDTKLIHRSLLHLYTLIINYQSEREIKKTIPFAGVSRRIKYLGINLSKKIKTIHH